MWINEATQDVFTAHADIRRAFPSVSLPAVITDEDLGAIGVKPVLVAEYPVFGSATHKCLASPSPELVDGEWVQGWEVIEKTAAEKAAAQQACLLSQQTACESAILALLHAKAKEYRYDSIYNVGIYVGRLPEADKLADWAAACWAKSFEIEQEVIAGTRVLPTVAEVMAEMPAYPLAG